MWEGWGDKCASEIHDKYNTYLRFLSSVLSSVASLTVCILPKGKCPCVCCSFIVRFVQDVCLVIESSRLNSSQLLDPDSFRREASIEIESKFGSFMHSSVSLRNVRFIKSRYLKVKKHSFKVK